MNLTQQLVNGLVLGHAFALVAIGWTVLLGVARLVELERITAASFPAHLAAGNFDRDGRPDLFWDIPNVNGGTSNFQLAYDNQVE